MSPIKRGLPERIWIDDRTDTLWMDRVAALVSVPEANLIEYVRADADLHAVLTTGAGSR